MIRLVSGLAMTALLVALHPCTPIEQEQHPAFQPLPTHMLTLFTECRDGPNRIARCKPEGPLRSRLSIRPSELPSYAVAELCSRCPCSMVDYTRDGRVALDDFAVLQRMEWLHFPAR